MKREKAGWRRDASVSSSFYRSSYVEDRKRRREAVRGATNFQRRRRWRQHLKLHARQINPPESEVLFPDCASRAFYLYLNLKMERSRERTRPAIQGRTSGQMNEHDSQIQSIAEAG